MKIVVAIDSFKGCLTSVEANTAARIGILEGCADAAVTEVAVSDGGEGWLDAFHAAVGGELVTTETCDALMRPIESRYLQKDELAVIETAQACGLTLLKSDELNPLKATTYGVGLLVADAIIRGCRHFIVGLGGSATSDAGIGMLKALSDTFFEGKPFEVLLQWKDLRFTIATDVINPLYGTDGAAFVFGRQKGASPAMIEELDYRAKTFAETSAMRCGHDCSSLPGAGAAGGLGYAFMQYLHADCRSGIDLLLDTIDFDQLLEHADMVVTGEGKADAQTLMGKLPQGIMKRASLHGVPTMLIAGSITDREALLQAGFAHVESINTPSLPLKDAMKKEIAAENIRALMRREAGNLVYKK